MRPYPDLRSQEDPNTPATTEAIVRIMAGEVTNIWRYYKGRTLTDPEFDFLKLVLLETMKKIRHPEET